jgi:molybdopterin converting factor small subunit
MTDIDIQQVLALLRESIGQQAQEIAVLKTVVAALESKLAASDSTESIVDTE